MKGKWVQVEVVHGREWNLAIQKDWKNTKSSNLRLNFQHNEAQVIACVRNFTSLAMCIMLVEQQVVYTLSWKFKWLRICCRLRLRFVCNKCFCIFLTCHFMYFLLFHKFPSFLVTPHLSTFIVITNCLTYFHYLLTYDTYLLL